MDFAIANFDSAALVQSTKTYSALLKISSDDCDMAIATTLTHNDWKFVILFVCV
jgi:hypothetical protein